MAVEMEMGREEAGGIDTAWTPRLPPLEPEVGRKSSDFGGGVGEMRLGGPTIVPLAERPPVPALSVPNDEEELLDAEPAALPGSLSTPSWLAQSSPLSS